MSELRIGLAFSGGGFRAAAFNLGVMSYMDRVAMDGSSLLRHVVALSTVSGGTIPGTYYALKVREENFKDIYDDLVKFLGQAQLVPLVLEHLSREENWRAQRIPSLINAFADIYDNTLFKGARFGEMMKDEGGSHLRHISFNATDFSFAKQFRFQWSEKILNPEPGEPPRGIIGNKYYSINEACAAEVRMADMLAASSCFPAGFEPINFPSDFVQPGSVNLQKLASSKDKHIALMDGGIVDNQGIEPLLLADDRIRKNENIDKSGTALDLLIISDVASPFMDSFKLSEPPVKGGWHSLPPWGVLLMNSLLLAAGIVSIWYFAERGSILGVALCSALVTATGIFFLATRLVKKLIRGLEVPESFVEPLGKLLRIPLGIYERMISNRALSVLKLSGEVFLKHVRSLNYDKVYEVDKWENKRIMNAIYELKATNPKLKEKIEKGELPERLIPSDEVQRLIARASAMGTTLWFSETELRQGMLNELIAAGQLTMCWNLLEYIHKIKSDRTNITPRHERLLKLEGALYEDWERFQNEPKWMAK